MERQMCSIMKACELTGVTRRTIYYWMEDGKVEFIRVASGSRRIFVDSLFREANGSRLRRESVKAGAKAADADRPFLGEGL